VTRGRLVVHAHFYQPSRLDPFTGNVHADPSAAPFHDWNQRITAECYRPNVERGTLAHLSFDLGPTLASWLAREEPATYAGFLEADRRSGGRAAIAQAYHHSILPLAPIPDRRTEIRWGLRDFELRFGRAARAVWLPETAVDLATLRVLAEEGIHATILAPWQAEQPHVDGRRPYRVDVGGGLAIAAAFYDGDLSGAVSFEPSTTADADRFARERVLPRLAAPLAGSDEPLLLLATDGELYGHHLPFRDLFLEKLVSPGASPGRGFAVSDLLAAVEASRAATASDRLRDRATRNGPTARQPAPDREAAGHPAPVELGQAEQVPVDPVPIDPAYGLTPMRIRERTSWSCHHGVLRWTAECPDAPDGRWKGPLRMAFDRLAGGIDTASSQLAAAFRTPIDPWAARDAYVDVLAGATEPEAFAAGRLGTRHDAADRRRLLSLMEAQRWRLAMFASDGWFWNDPVRQETRQVLRAAARAARLVDELTRGDLERRLVADLAAVRSPSLGIDGATIYRQALSEIGQPPPRA
jgi:hypothetical protein